MRKILKLFKSVGVTGMAALGR